MLGPNMFLLFDGSWELLAANGAQSVSGLGVVRQLVLDVLCFSLELF